MIQYIYKKMICDKKETIGDILIISCIIAMLTICLQIVSKLTMVLKDNWLEDRLQVVEITDTFIRGKLGVIIVFVFLIIGIIYVFGIVLFGIKLQLEIVKERAKISVFQVLGYTNVQISISLFIGKMIEIIVALLFGTIFAWGIWKILCEQDVFYNFIIIFDNNIGFQMEWTLINMFVMIFFSFPVIYMALRKKVHIMDMKGEE